MSSDLVSSIAALATPVVINAVIAWLIVNWVWFASLDPQAQKLVKVAIAAVMSLVSYGLLQLIPANLFAQLQPVYAILYAAIVGVLSQEVTVLATQWRAAVKERFALEELKALIDLNVALTPDVVGAIFPRRSVEFHKAVATAKPNTILGNGVAGTTPVSVADANRANPIKEGTAA